MSKAQAPISWGDELRPDSVWSWPHLGYNPSKGIANITLVFLSRDGSRRIVRGTHASIAKASHHPEYAVVSNSEDTFQSWEGIKIHAEWLKDNSAQTVLMLENPRGEGAIGVHKMPGLFMPNGVIGAQTRPVLNPVNPIPATSEIRDDISAVAAGWDVVWHSRYVFSDHLRQQVTGRLMDGLLANIERSIQTLLTNARPAENTYWKAKLNPIKAAAKAVCGICTGDAYVWARVLARNIDLDAFRLRLDKGQIPSVNMATKPFQPGTSVLATTFPANTDVNAKKELVARWHDTNQATVESDLLRWYDEVYLDPEPSYEAADDHFHGR